MAPTAYIIGIAAIVTSGIILRKFRFFAARPSPFVMELPPITFRLQERRHPYVGSRKGVVQKAGTIIFLSAIVVWFLGSFDWSAVMVDTADSILASIGRALAPVFAPLGFGQWEAAVASITGLVAKENLVGTFGILYGFAEVAEDGVEYWARLQAAFTPLAAFSLLVFNLLCAPCFAAIGAIRRERGGGR